MTTRPGPAAGSSPPDPWRRGGPDPRAASAGRTSRPEYAPLFRSTPCLLTPAGVVKHLTGTERFWFSLDFAGADVPWPWPDDDPHGNFRLAADDTLARTVAHYLAECEQSRRAVQDADLDDPARGPGMTFNLRHALAHMVEETARHCGHLDLLRERIDGQTGM